MRIYRDGRFQIQPSFGMTIADDFSRSMLAGVQIGYHFTDWLGLTAFFDYNLVTSGIEHRPDGSDHRRTARPPTATA